MHWSRANRYPPGSAEALRAGTYLADGFFCVLFALVGDLDYFSKAYGLPRWNSASPCCLCRCQKNGALTFFDNRYPGAPWLDTLWDYQSWWAWAGKPNLGCGYCEFHCLVAMFSGVLLCLDNFCLPDQLHHTSKEMPDVASAFRRVSWVWSG